jgi:hypothetical protein
MYTLLCVRVCVCVCVCVCRQGGPERLIGVEEGGVGRSWQLRTANGKFSDEGSNK